MSDRILLHQELLHLILYILDLVEVPCLPIASPSHPINIILSFIHTQTSVKVLIGQPLCLTHRLFCSLLCHLVLLYVVCTPIMIQALIALLLFLNSLLHIYKENGPLAHLLWILVFDDQHNQIGLMNLQVFIL